MDWTPDLLKARLNAYPVYAAAGVETTHVAEDWSEIRVRMALVEGNQNFVGTHFGGMLYAMVDPQLMLLLMMRLGSGYVVWDKAARIEFLRPGTGTVHARIQVTDDDLERIRAATADGSKYHPEWTLEVLNEEDEAVARVVKTLYVRQSR